MSRQDYRVMVRVQFAVECSATSHRDAEQFAQHMTEEVFHASYSRAEQLKIQTIAYMKAHSGAPEDGRT